MFVTPAEELATQMRRLGLSPEAVRTVVLTHLHGDHAGGLGFFPQAQFLVARAEYEGQLRQPMGAVRSLWPAGWSPQLVEHDGPTLDPFPFAGDLAFSEAQLRAHGLQGIAQNLGQARATLHHTWRFVQSTPTVFLPSHDPGALQRLRDGTTVRITASE